MGKWTLAWKAANKKIGIKIWEQQACKYSNIIKEKELCKEDKF